MSDKETIEVLVKALALIEANPEHWDQTRWHCGTTHCLAGFCDIVQDNICEIDIKEIRYNTDISTFSRKHQGLGYLFEPYNTLDYLREEINYLVEHGEITGFDSIGYDEDNQDREGYDREGYDNDGHNRKGYDRDGYDEDGYDCDGYNDGDC